MLPFRVSKTGSMWHLLLEIHLNERSSNDWVSFLCVHTEWQVFHSFRSLQGNVQLCVTHVLLYRLFLMYAAKGDSKRELERMVKSKEDIFPLSRHTRKSEGKGH